jgi:hypothetical protein
VPRDSAACTVAPTCAARSRRPSPSKSPSQYDAALAAKLTCQSV